MRLRSSLALLAVLVGGLASACGGTATSGGGAAALESLAGVADASRGADSGRFSYALEMAFAGQELGLTGEGAFDSRAGRARVTMDMSSFAELIGGLGGARQVPSGLDDPAAWQLESVHDGLVMYLRLPLVTRELPAGKDWIRLDLAALARRQGTELGQLGALGGTDPRETLEALKAISGPLEVAGREEVRGESTTRFRATIDPARLAGSTGAGVVDGLNASLAQLGLAELPVEVWVGGDGLLRRMALDLAANPPGSGEVKVRMTFEMFDYGIPVAIDLPPASRVADAAALGLN